MIGSIIGLVKSIILIVLSFFSCLELGYFFIRDESDGATIRDGLSACIFILLMILIIVS